jgi:NhaP-type Na+/H+ and K+/H+ antiporter
VHDAPDMTGAELIALGHAAMAKAHTLILVGGVLGLLSIVAGLVSRHIGVPMLLVFLASACSPGEDGLLGIAYDDFASAYLIGSVALAVTCSKAGSRRRLRCSGWRSGRLPCSPPWASR